MASLLSSLEQPTKQPFQLYTIEHGIERIGVRVPLAEAKQFEAAFASSDSSKQTLLNLVTKHGGSILETR